MGNLSDNGQTVACYLFDYAEILFAGVQAFCLQQNPTMSHTVHSQTERHTMDRTTLNQQLSKVIAYRNCNKPELANQWAQQLVDSLRAQGIKVS